MRRFILPLIGILAAAWAAYAIVHTTTHRESTIPPSPPPVSDFRDTVAAVGLVEASTENIAIGTPLSGIVPKVFVGAGDAVRAGDPLFE
jgi:multidrug efflux pump subunit AcrA (membrane-fusion protein)